MFYRVVRALFRVVAAPLFRFKVEGTGFVPREGAAILVAPHHSWLDPACIGGACSRPVRFLIIAGVYHWPWANWFYRAMGGLPVENGPGRSSGALRGALRLLRAGELVGIFPQGGIVQPGRSVTVRPGAAMLALHTGAPVIPVRIVGSARAWPHGRWFPGPARVRVAFGPALELPDGRGREAVEELSRRIERALDGGAGEAG